MIYVGHRLPRVGRNGGGEGEPGEPKRLGATRMTPLSQQMLPDNSWEPAVLGAGDTGVGRVIQQEGTGWGSKLP